MLKTSPLVSLRKIILLSFIALGACAPLSKTRPTSFIEPATGMKFVFVEGGSYQMGDPQGKTPEASPPHKIALPGFHVGIYEVTFDQYDRFCEATGRKNAADLDWGREDQPVINVSWKDAQAMADWLSQQTGLPFSLPTEAQWEYFARSGSSSAYWTGTKLPDGYAACADCGSSWDEKQPAPVGSFPPNGWGIYDTAGNVAEWTLDDPHENYLGAPSDGQAWLREGSVQKIYRGGAFSYYKGDLMSATRDWTAQEARVKDIGFRLVINRASPDLERP